jgi:hypothetical protein
MFVRTLWFDERETVIVTAQGASTRMATNDTTATASSPRAPRAAARRRAATRRTAARGGTVSAAPATPTARAQQLAERVVLIPVGAALEARDRVVEALDTVVATSSSRRALDQQLKRFEHRGGRARMQLEREVRKTRTRLEREVRHGRTRVEREVRSARRGVDTNLGSLQGRVENVVQNGVNAGITLVNGVQDRITTVV